MSEHDDRLRELGKQLPWDRPDGARRDAVRSSLLVAAAEGDTRPTTRWYVIGGAFAAGALVAAAALLLLVRPGERPVPRASAAQIVPSPAAQFDRVVTRTPTGVDEVVRLRAGKLTMSVGALRAGDHVRVATRDAEVEGQGSYDVVVEGEQLRDVTVLDGHVTIRMTGQKAVFLSAGQSWQAKAIVAHADLAAPRDPATAPDPAAADPATAADPAPPAPAPAPAPAPEPATARASAAAPASAPAPDRATVRARATATDRVPAAPDRAPGATADRAEAPTPDPSSEPDMPATSSSSVVAGAPERLPAVTELPVEPSPVPPPAPSTKRTGPNEVERRFQAGMALLKANKPAEAARELGAAADAGGDDPLAADARYFQASALVKAGRKTEAEKALVAFLDRAPKSIRRGRAAVMLGRLIAERGDHASARAWFESALGDADASVVAAAKAGIAGSK